jgi:hypothetical protein
LDWLALEVQWLRGRAVDTEDGNELGCFFLGRDHLRVVRASDWLRGRAVDTEVDPPV